MFIKLTRLDNRPVWLNAAFVVTVEPRRDGNGAVVVPIGDGLDYDVRERPEEVLRMLDGCPAPKVVPVPVSDCLTKMPTDVSPEPEPPRPIAQKPVESKPAETRPVEAGPVEAKPTEAKPVEPEPAATTALVDELLAEEKPKKRATRARTKKPAAVKKERPAKKPTLELADEDVARLQKLSPKSIAKLKNTLVSQFRVSDVSETVAALEAKGFLALDGNHVNWKTE